MAQYDPTILQKHADRLYSQANSTIAIWTLAGILLGALGGLALGTRSSSSGPYSYFGAILLGLIGLAIGREKAFDLKLKAQIALCQLKIEENTRSQSPAKSGHESRNAPATSSVTSLPSPSAFGAKQAPPPAPNPPPEITMRCPKCGFQYPENFKECQRCRVSLVPG